MCGAANRVVRARVLVPFLVLGLALAAHAEIATGRAPRSRLDVIHEMASANADLAFLGGPRGSFWSEVRGRFAAQKRLTPERPYAFPIPELGKTVTFMRLLVAERLAAYGRGKAILWRARDLALDRRYRLLGLRGARARLYARVRAERDLLARLLADLERLDEGAPPYDELIRLTYFVTRALSMTPPRRQFWPHRFLDLAQETGIGDPRDELFAYRAGARPFATTSNLLSRYFVFGHHEELFPPDDIPLVLLPLVGRLTPRPFLAHRNEPLALTSVISGNLKADGWNMNEHQLMVHDYYFHAAQKHLVDGAFRVAYRVSEAQADELDDRQRRWFELLTQRIAEEPDPKLRAAIRMMTAYVLHDRPRAFFPDSFLDWRRLMILAKIRHKITGQLHIDQVSGALFEHLRYNRRALRWLHAFWRAPEIVEDPLVQALRRQRLNADRTPRRSSAPPR